MKQTSTLKKLLAVFTFLIITAITLTLASCGTGNWNTEEEDSTAETKQEALAPITFDFESNGDGTCKITGVSINDSTLTDINLEFPQKSPAGEDVTVIDLAPSTTYGNVPTMILREDFEKLKDTIEANIAANDRENKFLFDKSMSFYSFQDPSTVSDYIKEAMLKNIL